ncbi:MAG TPA: hypothetical protein VHE30_23975 [Polyangiaceae bacterium]|nr:hypothetical protein [Polyangiaceae bacterium]
MTGRSDRGRALWATFALAVSAATATTGCTIVGATVGSLIPKSAPLPAETTANRATVRDDVEIERHGGQPLAGTYGGEYDERLWVETPAETPVPEKDVKDARFRQGNHFLEGLLVGLALDATILAVVGSREALLPDLGDRHAHVGADGVDVKNR